MQHATFLSSSKRSDAIIIAITAHPNSLKALSKAVLERNQKRNPNATNAITAVNTQGNSATNSATHLSTEELNQEIELKLKYNSLLLRERNGEKYLDDPCRTEAEQAKALPIFQGILGELNQILCLIGVNNTTEEERMNGFDIIPLLGKEVSSDLLPPEWR